jgi:hypothetical protein
MALTFDATYYYKNRPDVLEAFLKSGTTLSEFEFALSHYNNHGWKEGANPSAVFNTTEYLNANPDVKAAGVNPFEHFNQHGLAEGRAPSSQFPSINDFDWEAYVNSNPDLQAAGITTQEAAYAHFINHGYGENRVGAPNYVPEPTPLHEALADLQAAKKAVADFNEDNGDVVAALEKAQEALTDHIHDNGSDARLAANVAIAEAELSIAQDELEAVQGLANAVEALETSQTAYVASVNAAKTAYVAFSAEAAGFAFVNELSLSGPFEEFDDLGWGDLADLEEGTVVFSAAGNPLIVIGANGTLELAEASDDFDPVTLIGIDELLADAQAAFVAALAYAEAREAFEAAILDFITVADPDFDIDSFDGDLNDFYNEYTGKLEDGVFGSAGAEDIFNRYQAVLQAEENLKTARDLVEERAGLRADIAEAQALVDALEELNDGVASAIDVIKDLGFDEPEELSGSIDATESGKLLLYAGIDPSTDEEIVGFGADDALYIGNGYKLVKLGADADLDGNTDYGNVAELEIFLKQVDEGTLIYIEGETYSGQLDGGFAGETITLVGVDASSITFENGILRVAGSEIA